MKTSRIVGKLDASEELIEHIDNNDEEFILTTVTMDNESFPAVIAKSIFKGEGRYEMDAYVGSTMLNKHLFTFVRVITVTPVDESVPDRNIFYADGKVVGRDALKAKQSSGLEVLPFVVCYFANNKKNVLHCAALGKLARDLNDLEVEEFVSIEGQLTNRYKRLEFKAQNLIRRGGLK